jgi:hypothetical protein
MINTLTFEQINRLLSIVKKIDSDYGLHYVDIDEERTIDKELYFKFSTENFYLSCDNDVEWLYSEYIDIHIAALESDENAELYVLWRESLIGGDLHNIRSRLDVCNKNLKKFNQDIKNIKAILKQPKSKENSVIPIEQKNLIPYLNTQLKIIERNQTSESKRLKKLAVQYRKYTIAKQKWEKIIKEYKKYK